MNQSQHRSVRSGALRLAVREHSAATGAHSVVLVHGYPDRQQVWDAVVAALPHDELHLVTYDVRGAGCSDVPIERSGFRTERLVADLAAVVDAVVPRGRPVHLVGHDWGSVQLWDAVDEVRTDPRLRGRVASFTSISGPSLDHLAWLFRAHRGEPAQLRQALHSWYVGLFGLPVLPELLWRTTGRVWVAAPWSGPPWTGRVEDAVHGLELYRANVGRRMRDPGRLRTDVPVLLVHPTRDRFVTAFAHADLERSVPDLRRVSLDAGHWVPRSHPEQVAALLLAHVRAHPG